MRRWWYGGTPRGHVLERMVWVGGVGWWVVGVWVVVWVGDRVVMLVVVMVLAVVVCMVLLVVVMVVWVSHGRTHTTVSSFGGLATVDAT